MLCVPTQTLLQVFKMFLQQTYNKIIINLKEICLTDSKCKNIFYWFPCKQECHGFDSESACVFVFVCLFGSNAPIHQRDGSGSTG